ncbi:MAG TPA: DUF4129 domain-containing protein [Candidatus Didemnitutus sp.]|nr:DUF4129 domain-containing protein [Candidatus Didemnitutus sp.]
MTVVGDTILQKIPPASVAWLDSLRLSPDYQYQHAGQSRSIWSIILEFVGDYIAEILDGNLNSTADYASLIALGFGVGVLIYLIRRTGVSLPFRSAGSSLVRTTTGAPKTSIDLLKLTQVAEQEHEYALALRYTYLRTLSTLDGMGRIALRHHRTDTDYIRDLRSDPSLSRFRQAIDVFRRTWYGGATISHDEYMQARRLFDEIIGGRP